MKISAREAVIVVGVSRPLIRRTSMSMPAVVFVVEVRGPVHVWRRGWVDGFWGFRSAEVVFGVK